MVAIWRLHCGDWSEKQRPRLFLPAARPESMVGSGASAPRRRLAAVTALALALAAASQAGASGPHERACGAAFGVLRHCAAAGGGGEDVRARCCGLLEAFQHNGCLW